MNKIDEKELKIASNSQTIDNNEEITEDFETEEIPKKNNENILKENIANDTEAQIVNDTVKESSTQILEEKNNISKKIHKKTLFIILALILVAVLFLLSTIFALVRLGSNTIASGVSIKGIDISGLTKEEAYLKLEQLVTEKLSTPFELIHNDSKTTIIAEQLNANFDIEDSINSAYEIGRNNNIFKSNFEIISSFFTKIDIIPSFSYNEETINNLISEINNNLPDKLTQPSYYIDKSNLIIVNGHDGVVVNQDKLKSKIISSLNDLCNKNESIEIPITDVKADKIDIDAIHSEIYKEPKDAYYTKNPFVVYPHVDGIDFANTIDEIKQMLQEYKESYIIPIKVTTPLVTTNNIGTEAFPDLLATYSTNYSASNVNRTTNIKLASAKINGIVLMPGEAFSYNTTVGKRTAANGFKPAAVYSGGEVTTGIGGGICQVSSTLYNSVLLSNLQILERHNHGFNTGYVPAGRDATVSWGGPDFKFKNSRNYPIKIICTNSGETITTKIFGLKEENEYEVEVQSYITSYIQYKTITKQDPTLAAGKTKVIANGSNGCKAVSYRILKQHGQVISKTLLANDTYNPHNKIVAVGIQ